MQGGSNFAFIDSQNLNLAIKNQGWQLDLKLFFNYLQEKYNVEKAFIFLGYIDRYQPMYKKMVDFGYSVIFKPTFMTKAGKLKGNIDGELILHTLLQYHNYEKAIIVTGDGDFFCLIEYLQQTDKLAKIIIPNRLAYSNLLKPFVSEYGAYLNDLRYKLQKT